MTTANEEFLDLMPHRIEVEGPGEGYDDYGEPVTGAEKRVYACLVDDSTTTVRTADGTSVTVALTAYVAPVPIGGDGPVDILEGETIKILAVGGLKEDRVQINSVERHFDSEDGVGMLHNIVVRLG